MNFHHYTETVLTSYLEFQCNNFYSTMAFKNVTSDEISGLELSIEKLRRVSSVHER